MWLSTFVDPVSNETLLSPIPKGNYKLQISLAQNNNNATKHFFLISSIRPTRMYVGKTSRQLKQCISEHKSLIKWKDMNYPVALCFNKFNRNVSTLRFCGIGKVKVPPKGGDTDIFLQRRQVY